MQKRIFSALFHTKDLLHSQFMRVMPLCHAVSSLQFFIIVNFTQLRKAGDASNFGFLYQKTKLKKPIHLHTLF